MKNFPQKMRMKAKRYYIEHEFTLHQILEKLKIDYPHERQPASRTTLSYWKRIDGWKDFLDKAKRKETLVRRKEIIKEIVGD